MLRCRPAFFGNKGGSVDPRGGLHQLPMGDDAPAAASLPDPVVAAITALLNTLSTDQRRAIARDFGTAAPTPGKACPR